jgi:hypothetical protein
MVVARHGRAGHEIAALEILGPSRVAIPRDPVSTIRAEACNGDSNAIKSEVLDML